MDQLIESPAFEDVRQRTQQPEPEALAATRGSGFRRHSELQETAVADGRDHREGGTTRDC